MRGFRSEYVNSISDPNVSATLKDQVLLLESDLSMAFSVLLAGLCLVYYLS